MFRGWDPVDIAMCILFSGIGIGLTAIMLGYAVSIAMGR